MFPKLFRGCVNGEYDIKLDERIERYNLTMPRRITTPLLPKVKEEIERMERIGVIERVDKPTKWCTPIVVVPKKNGVVRIVVILLS